LTDGVLPFVVEPPPAALADAAAGRAAHAWSLPAPLPIRRGMNAIYEAGEDVVLRVSRPTAPARVAIDLATVLTHLGVLVPQVVRPEPYVLGEIAVVAVERLVAVDEPVDWAAIGVMVQRVHDASPESLPHGLPTPRGLDFPWWRLDEVLESVADNLDDHVARTLRRCIDRHRDAVAAARSANAVVCHGDVHPGNVMMTSSGPVLLDWDLVCREHRAWDHAMLLRIGMWQGGDAPMYDAFSDGYGLDLRGDPVAEAFAELRLVAATLMRVRAGLVDRAAAAEAERRLRWWRGDPEAPMWQPM
jgi:hypothetical protein